MDFFILMRKAFYFLIIKGIGLQGSVAQNFKYRQTGSWQRNWTKSKNKHFKHWRKDNTNKTVNTQQKA